MIVYFADRQFNILGSASTGLPSGLVITDDNSAEDIETGVSVFECEVRFDNETRAKVEACTEVGNFIILKQDDEDKLYTIIDADIETNDQTATVYAEDAGLDLLNEVVGAYEADKAYAIEHYVEKFAYDSGFRIGTNEAAGLTRKLSWDGEETVTARLASVATQFDGCEISYGFTIKGLKVTDKFINIYKKRGKDVGTTLRLNREVDNITIKKTIANLATALRCKGGTPENEEDPITLRGYSYDDGDFYIDGDVLKSREALKKWSRYINPNEPNLKTGHEGHIVRPYSYDTIEQSTLCAHAITELKGICDKEVNYEVDILYLPKGVKVGDRVNIVDENGKLYLSTRLLKLERSAVNDKHKAVLGEHLIKGSGISQKVIELAEKHAQTALSAARALTVANKATETATAAKEQANTALADAEKANQAATEAATAANTATQAAQLAQEKANNAQAAVDIVEESVVGLETTVANAEAAAEQARQAAQTADAKAVEAQQAASNAQTKANEAATAAGNAQSSADSATTKANAAQSSAEQAKADATAAATTAAAAKLDAENAQKDIDALGESLTTLESTMNADYARKTDLTEATASLQTQITQNAAEITSTASRVQEIDETANNAQAQAQSAQSAATEAKATADQATADAQAAQTAADTAAAAAASAQSEADTAKAAAATAKSVADKAEADLEAAKADLATVTSRVGATEEEIAAAQQAVEAAQTAADNAQAEADEAAKKAASAQSTADTAVSNAATAQNAANEAASKADLAQQTADEAKGNAAAAQAKANEAAQIAASAQETADTAKTNATNAQAKADQAAIDASNAQKAADDADAKAAQAASDLATAQQNLANVASRVDATEEEVAAAQAAVATAQAAANQAKEEAEAAQTTADTAKANAAKAQTAADNAKAAADAAQADAEAAQKAADDAQAAVDALAVRVTTAETKITQNSEQIALMATKTEVTETLGGYYTKAQTDAAIKVSADEINLNVEKQIDGIQIGTRNLLLNTGDMLSGSNAIKNYLSGNSLIDTNEGAKLQFTTNANNAFRVKLAFDGAVDNDEKVTLSFDYRGNITTFGRFAFLQRTTPHVLITGFPDLEVSETSWKHYSYTFSNANANARSCYEIILMYGVSHTTDEWVEIKKGSLKLERGTKETDWTPAPEDVDAKLLEQGTSIRQDASAIVLTATESLVDKKTYEDFKKQIEAEFKVLADKIVMNFATATEQTNSVDSDLQAKFIELYKHISFDLNGITIGGSENGITLNMDNDQIVFSKNGVEVVRLDLDNFTPTNVYIKPGGRLRLGNFAFDVLDDGTPAFWKVGG